MKGVALLIKKSMSLSFSHQKLRAKICEFCGRVKKKERVIWRSFQKMAPQVAACITYAQGRPCFMRRTEETHLETLCLANFEILINTLGKFYSCTMSTFRFTLDQDCSYVTALLNPTVELCSAKDQCGHRTQPATEFIAALFPCSTKQ